MLRHNKISPKKPCPFCGAFLENEAPSTIWCHPRNSCLLSLRGIVGADQIAQWDTRYDVETSIALGILQEMNGGVVIYHEASKEDPENFPAGWYIDDKDYTTFSIANDPEAVKCLKAPLKKGGYNFEERKAFWDSFFNFKTPKLRLPVKIAKTR